MTNSDARGRPLLAWSLVALCALLPLAGCGHTEPFSTPDTGSEQPFDPGPPVRLTINLGPDRDAAWLADGSGIFYSAQQTGRSDHDICLALLPPAGGRQRQLTCDLPPSSGSVTDALEAAAPAGDRRLAYVAASSSIGATIPNQRAIVLATVNDPTTRRVLKTTPYTIPGGRQHSGVSQLAWLSQNQLIYLGETVTASRPCRDCSLDTLRSGQDAALLTFDATGATVETVPGTDFSSGVSPGAGTDEVYYTLNGDSRVFRRTLSSGEVAMVHDFGSLGVARDVHVIGSRLAAVVGGRVSFGTDPVIGPVQWDSGGVVHVITLPDGADAALAGPGLFRRPRLSPSGGSLVAEGYPLIITDLPDGSADTTVSRDGDLYLFGLP
jgi:hypothetical protein